MNARKNAFCATELPWLGGPRVFSLMFVQIYLASLLVGIFEARIPIQLQAGEIDDTPEGKKLKVQWKRDLTKLSADLNTLGLKLTKASVDRFLIALPAATAIEAEAFSADLEGRLWDEAELLKFIYVAPDKMDYYNNAQPFGPEVEARFPSAEYDICEAAKCFALGRHTATVMHSMRALEVGLASIAHALKVNRSSRGWGSDLKIFADAWQKKLTANPKVKGWRRSFFPQAFAEFRNFAAAWRNRAMHAPHAHYGEDESKRVFEHVESFMRHLATRLREPRKQRRP